MINAAIGGHLNIVEFFISQGANDFEGALRFTEAEGSLRPEITNLLQKKLLQ